MKNTNNIQSSLIRLKGKRKAFKARCKNISDIELRMKIQEKIDDITYQIIRMNTIIKLNVDYNQER